MFNLFKLQEVSEKNMEKVPATKVSLQIFRHSFKESDPNKVNSDLLLTPEGRELARLKGEEFRPYPERAVAGASPMDRAAETAMLAMLADEKDIETDDSLEKMEAKVKEQVPVGKKLYRDERLGFALSNGPVGQIAMDAFRAGNYMNWLVQDSDRQVLENKDLETTSYLRQASNIAELVARYQAVGNNFNRLVTDPKKQTEHGQKLERYLATHQTVLESFVAKVLEIQEGLSARDEFSEKLGNGWAEMEGVRIDILNDSNGQRMFIAYKDGDKEEKELLIKPETIEQIIVERAELERACQ
jgi:hypothetical protein